MAKEVSVHNYMNVTSIKFFFYCCRYYGYLENFLNIPMSGTQPVLNFD